MADRRRAGTRPITAEVGYHDLLRDLRRKGCPVCRGADRAAWRYVEAILWESVNDPPIRARLRAAHGFCRDHGFMAIAVCKERGLASGLATMYEDFIRRVTDEAMKSARSRGKRPRGRGRSEDLAPLVPCPACASADAVATNYLHILAVAPEDSPAIKAAMSSGRRLCFRHLRRGLDVVSADQITRLARIFARGNEEIGENLREFVRKHDYRFQAEGMTPAEAASWTAAVYAIVGEPPPNRAPAGFLEEADDR